MTRVLHVSTECYPAAKAGGMGDVVGAIPIYSKPFGIEASVIIPHYKLPWFSSNSFEQVYSDSFQMGEENKVKFTINKLTGGELSFDFYSIDIPGKFDRNSIYLAEDGEGFADEVERNFSFQRAVLLWLRNDPKMFDLVHCHDHQAGLIPFFMSHGWGFESLKNIPTYFTIHNAAYRGMWDWKHKSILPPFDHQHVGLLDWDNHIHSFASAIKCCWGYNTVSPSYLEEISHNSGNLNWLFDNTKEKARGILNGIDIEAWNPADDKFLDHDFKRTWNAFKKKNKSAFVKKYKTGNGQPLFSFIGRLAHQKGADILIRAIESFFNKNKKAGFILLGSGNKELERDFRKLSDESGGRLVALISYDEAVSHKIYAASDFLVMPSRFEPCGLNQMFAMRYGTIPVVRATGGLKDTVTDIDEGGFGICFENADANDLTNALHRASDLYNNKSYFDSVRDKAGERDNSWERSVAKYSEEYQKILNKKQ